MISMKLEEPLFIEVNFKLLAFKYPIPFDGEITKKIIHIFKSSAKQGKPFLSLDELETHFKQSITDKDVQKQEDYRKYLLLTGWNKKHQDEIQIVNKLRERSENVLRENYKLLIESEILKPVMIARKVNNNLIESKEYYLHQTNNDMIKYAYSLMHEEINNFILEQFESLKYPFIDYPDYESLNKYNLDHEFFNINHLIKHLLNKNELIQVPILKETSSEEVFIHYILPGKSSEGVIISFINDYLIPTLQSRFPLIYPKLSQILNDNKMFIEQSDITRYNTEEVYKLCFVIMDAKNDPGKVSVDDINLAQLILNCWLALEEDPLQTLRKYPEAALLGEDFFSPFLTQYINDYSHIEHYLKTMQEFVSHLPQIIEYTDLFNFFANKGVQKKIVDKFLTMLPNEIISITSDKKRYIVSKSQIIPALIYLYNGEFYKLSEAGEREFNTLTHTLYTMEESFKDYNNLIDELSTTPSEFQSVKRFLVKTPFYKFIQKKRKSSPVPEKQNIPRDNSLISSIPTKKIYTEKDFEKLNKNDVNKIIQSLNLKEIECIDMYKNIHLIYLKKADLNIDDARFFRGNPTYELIKKRFNL